MEKSLYKKFIFSFSYGYSGYIELKLFPKSSCYHWETLEKVNNVPIFSVMGMLYKGNREQNGGQCDSEFRKLVPKVKGNKDLLRKILRLWEKYHLNDMVTYSKEQYEYLKKYYPNFKKLSYEEKYEILSKAGLNKEYKYGSKWLYRPIPEDDLKLIKDLLEDKNGNS